MSKAEKLPQQIWQGALESYCYKFDRGDFPDRDTFPGWFCEKGDGFRKTTKDSEDRFRERGHLHLEAWYEVVYWKMYANRRFRDKQTRSVIERVASSRLTAADLWNCCCDYVNNPSRDGIASIARKLLSPNTRAVAIAATFPAFMAPDRFPMVDTRVAEWAAVNDLRHNAADPNGPQLVRPKYPGNGATVVTLGDWPFIESWIYWCRYTAAKLRSLTGYEWRARDVEMAVFSASGAGIKGKTELPLLAPMS